MAIVKIVAFFILWLLLWLPIAIPLAKRLQWRPFQPSTAAQKLPLLAGLYLVAPITLAGFCWLEQTSFADYGMPLTISLWVALGWGFLAGSGGLAAVFYGQYQFGWLSQAEPQLVSLKTQPRWHHVGLMLILALWIGWTEELIFRGFLQSQLQQVLPFSGATAIASCIFAGLHGLWEGKSVVPQLLGLWLMGIVLVLACWVDQGNLGLAWGLHAGWVWVLASLDSWQLQYTQRVPAWITGFNDQPLAGAVGLIFLGGTAAALIAIGWGR